MSKFATVMLFFLNFYAQTLSIAILSQKNAFGACYRSLSSTPLDPEHLVLKIQGHSVVFQQIRAQT